MRKVMLIAAAGLMAALAAPALADVKAGVDAWARGDYRKAIAEWRGPAAAGDADAQFNLGQAYKLGRGVPVDLGMAEEWYRKAAQQGHPQAEDNYGLALFQNNKRDQAVPWLEKSVARGEPRAQYVLGTMYFNADVVKRDWVRAYALMTRAAAAGLGQATTTLMQMDKYIPLADRQRGVELARRYETEIGRPPAPVQYAGPTAGQGRPVVTTPLPASQADSERVTTGSLRSPPPARPKPGAGAEQSTRSAPASGNWRVQLGAFRDVGNARGLFAQLQRRGLFAGRQSYLVKSGALTRLLVGPFATSAEAAGACRGVNPCVPVRN